MKQKLSYIFTVLAIAASLVFPAVAVAEQSSSNSSGTDDNVTEIEGSEHSMNGRIAKFKTEFKVDLNDSESAHIKLACVGAQGKVSSLKSHFGEKATSRTKTYGFLQDRLASLVTKLKAKNADTTTLEANITVLNEKIATYNTDLTAYQQALTDLKTVDCKVDPDGFQAALLAARSAHDTLVNDVLAIRTYLLKTLKPTLQTIRQDLAKDTSNDNETKTETETEGSN